MLNRMFMKALIGLLLGCFLSTAGATETVIYYHNDALGSPIAATNAEGQVVWREQYEPYGERLVNEPKSRNPLWYTGKPEEEALGLSYFGARWYNPKLGRFMGMDPVEAQAGNLHSFNRYAYANNNPYKFVDPDGNSPLDVGFFIADSIRFGLALYSGNAAAIQSTGIDLAASAVGLASPVPGMGQAFKAARAVDRVADVAKGLDHASDVAKGGNTVIGKVDDLAPNKLGPGERTLLDRLPDRGNPKANWKQNSSVLREEMRKGQPIRDASAHLPGNHPRVKGSFLGAERNLLRNQRWSFDKSTGFWNPTVN